MKTIILTGVLLSLLVSPPVPDQFQFIGQRQTSRFYVAYAVVTVFNSQGQAIFRRHTDGYGRITISLPYGTYRAELLYLGQRKELSLTIDGSQGLKIRYLSFEQEQTGSLARREAPLPSERSATGNIRPASLITGSMGLRRVK